MLSHTVSCCISRLVPCHPGTRPLTIVFVLISYALCLGGNPYEGMTGEEVFNFVASGQRMCRTSAMSSELYVRIISQYSLPQVIVFSKKMFKMLRFVNSSFSIISSTRPKSCAVIGYYLARWRLPAVLYVTY